jgi:hypothetical protein
MSTRPVHKIRTTVCGKARNADAFTPRWSATTCWDCLKDRPEPKSPGRPAVPSSPTAAPIEVPLAAAAEPTAPPAPGPPRDRRIRSGSRPDTCREGYDCKEIAVCWCCGRCAAHCVVKGSEGAAGSKIGDKPAHDEHWRLWKPEVKVNRRRSR